MLSPVFDNSPKGYGHYHKILKKHWRDFSPLHNIAAGAPPAIVFVGDSEKNTSRLKPPNVSNAR
jgi:hypothetical protein